MGFLFFQARRAFLWDAMSSAEAFQTEAGSFLPPTKFALVTGKVGVIQTVIVPIKRVVVKLATRPFCPSRRSWVAYKLFRCHLISYVCSMFWNVERGYGPLYAGLSTAESKSSVRIKASFTRLLLWVLPAIIRAASKSLAITSRAVSPPLVA